MSFNDRSSFRNRLLTALPDDDFGVLAPSLERVDLPLRTSLAKPGVPIEHVYFIEAGIASVVVEGSDGERVEVGHVGPEGMTGTPLCLGVDVSDTHTFMQAAGSATRIAAADFKAVIETQPALSSLLLRYVHAQQVQVAHSTLANARYGLRACLARWMLMAHDRLGADELPLTHEFLALMLGVRRAGVTDAMGVLEKVGAVKAGRGRIRVLDRQRLEKAAGSAYGQPEAVYRRLIG